MDLIGKKFGRLTVVDNTTRKGYVLCLCECGNRHAVRAASLTKKKAPTQSCGCLQREAARKIGSNTIAENSKERISVDVQYNTNFGVIEADKPPVNNHSGTKGIWFNKERNAWESYISVHGKKIHLGRYKDREEAVKARKQAEKEYFHPLIKAKTTNKEGDHQEWQQQSSMAHPAAEKP